MRTADPLLRLLSSPDRRQREQGMELAFALDDPGWFDAALRRVCYRDQSTERYVNHSFGRAFPGWMALALILRAPEGSAVAARLRAEITSLRLREQRRWPWRFCGFRCADLLALENLRGLRLEDLAPVMDLAALAALPRLERLAVSFCHVVGPIAGRFPALRALQVQGVALTSLAGLDAPRLEELELERTRFQTLGGLDAPRLRRLRLRDTPPEGLSFAGNFPALASLEMTAEPYAPRDLDPREALRELKVDLGGPLPPLPPGLERLDVGSFGAEIAVSSLAGVRELTLRRLAGRVGARLDALPRLERLEARGLAAIRGLEGLPALRRVELVDHDSEDLSDFSSLESLTWRHREPRAPAFPPRLRRLILDLPTLPRRPVRLPEDLEELNLRQRDRYGSLIGLQPHPRLRTLSLRSGFLPKDMEVLAEFPALEELIVSPLSWEKLPALPERVRIVAV